LITDNPTSGTTSRPYKQYSSAAGKIWHEGLRAHAVLAKGSKVSADLDRHTEQLEQIANDPIGAAYRLQGTQPNIKILRAWHV
jgi:hypothetical protein